MIERIDTSNFLATQTPPYHDGAKLFALYDKLAFNANLLLVGHKGLAKSLSIAAYCAKNQHPIITFDCSEDVRRSHLIGMFVLRGAETPFVLGALTTAFEVANEIGRCAIVLEEINALSPAIQKVLNAATDFRRRVEVPEIGKVFQLKEGAKLWILGTMNSTEYTGTHNLNEDLKSRFRIVPVEYPDDATERAILARIAPFAEEHIITKLLILAKETRLGGVESYALSTRDLAQVLEDIPTLGIKTALWLLGGKFEGETRDDVFRRIKSIFGLAVQSRT